MEKLEWGTPPPLSAERRRNAEMLSVFVGLKLKKILILPLSINRCLRFVKIWMHVDTI
jgi:hypothetical protein